MFAIAIIAVVLSFLASVIGWFATYLLTVRAQDRLLSCQLLGEARIEISSCLVAYEQWLKDLQVWLNYCGPGVTSINPGFAKTIGSAIAQLMSDRKASSDWESALLTWQSILPKLSTFGESLSGEQDHLLGLFASDARLLRDRAVDMSQQKLLNAIKRMAQARPPLEQHIDAVSQARSLIDEECLAPVADRLKSLRRF